MIHNQTVEHCYRAVLPSIALSNAVSTSTDVTDGRTNEEGGSVERLVLRKQRAREREDFALVCAKRRATRYAVAS